MTRPFKKQADLVNVQTQRVDGVEHFGTSTFRQIYTSGVEASKRIRIEKSVWIIINHF